MADDSFSLVAFDKAHYFSFPCHCRGETRMRVSAGRRRLCADAMAGPRLSSAVPEPRASSREPGAQPPGWGPHSPVGGRPPGRGKSKPLGGWAPLLRCSRLSVLTAQPGRATPVENGGHGSHGCSGSRAQVGLLLDEYACSSEDHTASTGHQAGSCFIAFLGNAGSWGPVIGGLN